MHVTPEVWLMLAILDTSLPKLDVLPHLLVAMHQMNTVCSAFQPVYMVNIYGKRKF